MIDPEMARYIDRKIKLAVQQIVTSGTAGATTITSEDISAPMPGMPTLPARPISQPYGFVSRAPQGMISVTLQQGEHPGNKMTIGHRDKAAPAIDEGESCQYSVGGYRVKVKNGEIFVGKGDDLEHMVVGETLKTFLISLIGFIVQHAHEGNLAFPTSVPLNSADFNNLKANFLDNDKILAKDGGRY